MMNSMGTDKETRENRAARGTGRSSAQTDHGPRAMCRGRGRLRRACRGLVRPVRRSVFVPERRCKDSKRRGATLSVEGLEGDEQRAGGQVGLLSYPRGETAGAGGTERETSHNRRTYLRTRMKAKNMLTYLK